MVQRRVTAQVVDPKYNRWGVCLYMDKGLDK